MSASPSPPPSRLHKNFVHHPSIFSSIDLGTRPLDKRYMRIDYKTDCTSVILPVKESDLHFHTVSLLRILSNNGLKDENGKHFLPTGTPKVIYGVFSFRHHEYSFDKSNCRGETPSPKITCDLPMFTCWPLIQ